MMIKLMTQSQETLRSMKYSPGWIMRDTLKKRKKKEWKKLGEDMRGKGRQTRPFLI
eukprot:403355756